MTDFVQGDDSEVRHLIGEVVDDATVRALCGVVISDGRRVGADEGRLCQHCLVKAT